ncbi:MAG: sugar phosphate nucleotidyltransferase [Ilumatobacteraceae bacterium]
MHAVVLVGGFGTRLRPLTLSVPKPLLPIVHVSILERLMTSLACGGVTDAVLSLGFKPEPFRAAFPDNMCGGVRLSYAVEDSPLDTAGAIGFAARVAGINDTFVVANGDVISDLDVATLVAFHRQRHAEGTLHLTPVEDPSQYGVVETDSTGRVQRFFEKPQPGDTTSREVSGGMYVLEPSALKRMPGTAPLSIERDTFPQMAKDGVLYALATNDYWIDAGQPDTYIRANLEWISRGKANISEAVHPLAQVSSSAHIRDSIIGAGVCIGNGAIVESSVLLPGAIVAEHARVVDSAVMGTVEHDATVVQCISGIDGIVAAGATLTDRRVPAPAPR